ncbi:MAG: cytochrome c family protein [Proteobacteria bacterium]|nr:cytochrome c family protein [Pseudomonadota bacterium]MCK4867843.1 cytochrome c family protein [Alphaproteobacteria bacterium]
MSNNSSLKSYAVLGLFVGVAVAAVVAVAYFGSMIVYRPAEIEKAAYPLMAVEEATPEAAAAAEEQPPEPEAPAATVVTAEPPAPETPAPEAPASSGEGIAALLAAADLAAGAKLSKKCKACHSFDKDGKNKVGPNLWDIVGNAIAGGEGYKFSGALTDMGGDWTYDNLDAFLTKPKNFAPGTKMSFSGLKSREDRANLIAFLRSLSDNPIPLP